MQHSYDNAAYRADIKACRRMLYHGSQSFYASSLLLPKGTREPASALYAFCRLADDLIDDNPDHENAVAELYDRLERLYAGNPIDHPADRALSGVVQRYSIPHTLPAALIEGFEWDIAGRRYETLSTLYDYAARVAGTVGVMMAMVMGARAPDVLARACDLGVAMQLTNIARDVGEDARNGRVYLPLDLLRLHGVDPDQWLEAPDYTDEVGMVVQTLLVAADQLYERAVGGIAQLPLGCRPGINAAGLIYAEIGRKIESNDCDSVSQRAVVGRRRKLELLGNAVRLAAKSRARDFAPPLKEVRFLVDAAVAARA